MIEDELDYWILFFVFYTTIKWSRDLDCGNKLACLNLKREKVLEMTNQKGFQVACEEAATSSKICSYLICITPAKACGKVLH